MDGGVEVGGCCTRLQKPRDEIRVLGIPQQGSQAAIPFVLREMVVVKRCSTQHWHVRVERQAREQGAQSVDLSRTRKAQKQLTHTRVKQPPTVPLLCLPNAHPQQAKNTKRAMHHVTFHLTGTLERTHIQLIPSQTQPSIGP